MRDSPHLGPAVALPLSPWPPVTSSGVAGEEDQLVSPTRPFCPPRRSASFPGGCSLMGLEMRDNHLPTWAHSPPRMGPHPESLSPVTPPFSLWASDQTARQHPQPRNLNVFPYRAPRREDGPALLPPKGTSRRGCHAGPIHLPLAQSWPFVNRTWGFSSSFGCL